MTTVPNAPKATVAANKIRGFLLDKNHPGNKGRANFFARFGFTPARWDVLRDALIAHVNANQIEDPETTRHGTVYAVRCSLSSPDGRNPCVSTIWTIEPSGGPKFVTAFPGTPPPDPSGIKP
jgi:filamentous hemagglutinin